MAGSPASDASPDPTAPATTAAGADEAPLRRIKSISHVMDDLFRVPGTDVRFGLDPVLGILPVAGDGFSMLFSLYIVLEAARAGVPRQTLTRMLAVVGVDMVAGSVPVIGPIFDAAWKANKWNVATLERHLQEGRQDEHERVPPGGAV